MSDSTRGRTDLRVPYAPGALACSALLLLSLGNLLLDKDLFHRVFVRPFQPEVRYSDPFTLPDKQAGNAAALPANPAQDRDEVVDIDIDPRPPRFDHVAFILRNWIVVGLTAIILWGAFRCCWTHRHELLTQQVLAFLLLLHVSNGFIMLGNVLCECLPLPGFILAVIGIAIMWAAGFLWRATGPARMLPGGLPHDWRRGQSHADEKPGRGELLVTDQLVDPAELN